MEPLLPFTTGSGIPLMLSPFQTDPDAKEHGGRDVGDCYGPGLVVAPLTSTS